jgi:hypothetical protein
MKNIWFIFFILSVSLFASGGREQQWEYIDLGEIQVPIITNPRLTGNYFRIPLPYVKPRGVTSIPVYEILSIYIDKLTVDGKKIRRKRLFLQEKTAIDLLNVEDAGEEEEEHFMEMMWRIVRDRNNGDRLLGVAYDSETGNTFRREEYSIPYGAREVFLTYRIRTPIYSSDWKHVDFYYTEQQTVKWTFVWPVV